MPTCGVRVNVSILRVYCLMCRRYIVAVRRDGGGDDVVTRRQIAVITTPFAYSRDLSPVDRYYQIDSSAEVC